MKIQLSRGGSNFVFHNRMRAFSRVGIIVESVYIYIYGFLPANGESIIHQLFLERKREARLGGCASVVRVPRARDAGLLAFQGRETFTTLWGNYRGILQVSLAAASFTFFPDSLPSFRKRSTLNFFVSFHSAEQSEMFRAVDGSGHREEQPTGEDIPATDEGLSR